MTDANINKLFAATGRLETISNMSVKHLPHNHNYSEEDFIELQRAAILILSEDTYAEKEVELDKAYDYLSAKNLSTDEIIKRRTMFYTAYDDCAATAKNLAKTGYGCTGETEQNTVVEILNLSRDKQFQEDLRKEMKKAHPAEVKETTPQKPHHLPKHEEGGVHLKRYRISQVA